MRKVLHTIFLHTIRFFFFLCFPIILISQPSYPTVNGYVIDDFDYTVAYIADGPVDVNLGKVPDMPGYYYWDAMKWYTKTSQATSWTSMTGHPNPLNQINKVLYIIPEGDNVYLGDNITAKNKLTLLVCGKLSLGKLTIDVPQPIVTFLSVGLGNDVDSPYSLNFSAVAELPEGHSMHEAGFYIALDPIFAVDPVYRVIDPSPINTGGNEFTINVNDYRGHVPDYFVDLSTYKVIAYATSKYQEGSVWYYETGNSLPNVFGLPLTGGKTLKSIQSNDFELTQKTQKETGSTISMNNFELILCGPESTFFVDVLDIKNNADLTINGTFYVNSLYLNNNYCITAGPNGVIMTPEGYIPPNLSLGTSANGCDDINEILPIELLSFTPEIKPDRILLNWTTGTEINNDYFTIERSRDLYGWEVMGFVEGAGNSSVPLSYSFSDMRPLDGLGYYRLKQTDFDGKYEYFGPIAAHYDLGLEGLDFKVMKQYTNWVIAVPNDGVYQVEVYNLQGHRLHSERVENNLSIPAPEGAVVIRVTDGFERSASRVVM